MTSFSEYNRPWYARRNQVASVKPRDARHVTDGEQGDPERFHIIRLCECVVCGGKGKVPESEQTETFRGVTFTTTYMGYTERCSTCRGEGRTRDLVATCATPEAVGVALVTLGREGEWAECPVGILDTQGQTGEKWIVRPWLPSARNVSDAGRTLAKAKGKK